uniref:Uncharacterized protein n=1 Tax=Oryza punctata TaxID=4537 RepID=A0A0E0M2Z2_ORYPU
MASPADDAFPALPPIRTALSTPSPPPPPPPVEVEVSASPSPPRVLLAAAGKRKSSSVVFINVPRDLSAVFRSLPPKKRIRACSSVPIASSYDLVDFYFSNMTLSLEEQKEKGLVQDRDR